MHCSSHDAYLSLNGVRREFADNTGLHETDLSVSEGEFISILGPSGCGKSTLLRCIAGLETPDAGSITLDGREVFGPNSVIPVNERGLSMVFQDLALWPHMSVEKNIDFPLSIQGVDKRKRKESVAQAMAMVGITSKANARPAQLSGGQQQRVAIARALVSNPRLLLMDEPLSALDAALRVQIRAELTRITRELGLTVIYVTHDQAEALAMSDRIAVMDSGSIVQFDDPVTLYEHPANDFVASFVGTMNHHPDFPPVRPENVLVSVDDVGGAIPAEVLSAHFVGGRFEVECAVAGAAEEWTVYSRTRLQPGQTLYLTPQGVSHV